MRKIESAEDLPRDAVVLVPGFIGFSRVGTFYYFSERIVAALRGALEASLGRRVVVVPCCTRPTDALHLRQAFLLDELAQLCDQLPGLERLHLIGHSAGGVDAQLLTCDRPLGDGSWTKLERVRSKICTVVALASPQRGSFLCRSDAARFLSSPREYYGGARAVARVFRAVLPHLLRHPATDDFLAGVWSQLPETGRFLRRLWQHRELIGELAPDAMAELRTRVKPERRVRLISFVTAAGLDEDAPVPPDPLFRDLYHLTSSSSASDYPGVTAALGRLRAQQHLICGETTLRPETLDAQTNDGVVSTALQLLDPDDPDEFGGLVVADHADVIGHYDRKPALLDEQPLNIGLFHSGSGFNDDSFFELYHHIAAAILRNIPDAQGAAARPPYRRKRPRHASEEAANLPAS